MNYTCPICGRTHPGAEESFVEPPYCSTRCWFHLGSDRPGPSSRRVTIPSR